MRRTCIQDISATKYVDSASSQLLMNQMSHMQYSRARLTVCKAGACLPLERDVWVSSLSTGGSGGEDRLTENITLNFEELKYQYTPQNDDGSSGTVISATITREKCR